ncbi:MAG: two-component system, OmpR family, sensor histidine kinase SenX3 [Actinomycetota bacterium]|jgi:two-component system sensor histidine kinase SenX3|nr:two-component system, OmpR family, sensor histidine kinase SenX3 [Actinomycetota bacterium]
MNALSVTVALLAAVAGAALGSFVGRRALRDNVLSATAASEAAESALRAQRRDSKEQLQVQGLILESMDDGVLLFDADGATVFANRSAEMLLGTLPAEVDALLPLDLQRAVQRAGYVGSEERAEAETGTPPRALRATATPAGSEGAVLLVVRDVTEALRIDSVRRDFVTNASHELKTPAAAIQAAAETLRTVVDEDPSAVPRFAEQLQRESLRLSRIVADLLDLSRLESGNEMAGPVRLDALVREECSRSEDLVRSAGIALTVTAGVVPPVLGSPRDLALVVRNLVDNAVRYTKAGGSVGVEVSAAGESVVLTVTDDGIGIPSRELPRVFERFYRVDRARSRETGGTGLGLAIVKHVAENLGGSVVVHSELGTGSTFEVRLPAYAPGP